MENLHTLTVKNIKQLCLSTGTTLTGTKPVLINELQRNLNKLPFQNRISNSKKNFNILSIDMGIKNFAYTRIELDKTLPFNRAPLVKEWVKFDVGHWANYQENTFEPKQFSQITYALVNEILFNPKEDIPDFILIERQRGRTMGSSNVIEWVFRVNMFEAMLHSLTYAKVKELGSNTDIISSSPKRMGDYWKPSIGQDHKKLKDNKDHRLLLVEDWLKHIIKNDRRYPPVPFVLSPERFSLDSLKDAKLSKSKSKWINQIVLSQNSFIETIYPGGLTELKDQKVKEKGDDLVDCLLHALAWLDWERNKNMLNLELKHEGLESALIFNEKTLARHYKHFDFCA